MFRSPQAMISSTLTLNLCISQFQLRPSPPPRATAGHLRTLSVPGVGHSPHKHAVSDSKSRHGGIYRKGPAVEQIGSSVKVEDWTNLKFSDFMHFFIVYQGTTRAIRNDQRESTCVGFIDQGFYNLNLVATILTLL